MQSRNDMFYEYLILINRFISTLSGCKNDDLCLDFKYTNILDWDKHYNQVGKIIIKNKSPIVASFFGDLNKTIITGKPLTDNPIYVCIIDDYQLPLINRGKSFIHI
jgi:hypothetical protein